MTKNIFFCHKALLSSLNITVLKEKSNAEIEREVRIGK